MATFSFNTSEYEATVKSIDDNFFISFDLIDIEQQAIIDSLELVNVDFHVYYKNPFTVKMSPENFLIWLSSEILNFQIEPL